MDYPIRFTDQIRHQLRALRKARGLTQAELGNRLGVGQARIAEIERTPGTVSFDQMLQILSLLDASLVLRDLLPEKLAGAPSPHPIRVSSGSAAHKRFSGLPSTGKPPQDGARKLPRAGHKKPAALARITPPVPGKLRPSAAPKVYEAPVIRPRKGSW